MSGIDPHLLQAGRYAVYVRSAYGISALGLLALVVDTLLRARRWRRRAEPPRRPHRSRQRGPGPRQAGPR